MIPTIKAPINPRASPKPASRSLILAFTRRTIYYLPRAVPSLSPGASRAPTQVLPEVLAQWKESIGTG
jgi:hypothetical protein